MLVDYDLDIVGVLEGTDKCSSIGRGWDYLRKYQTLFAHLRDEQFNLIEIGVASGASIRMWKSFFRRAHIIGVDIQPACERFASDRVTIEIGSQENPEFLARLCAAYPPTIIIEDGSHLAHHVIYTFERMYPSLLPGGFYVAEDMHFHSTGLAEQQKTHGGPTPPDYFAAIMRSRMLVEPPPKDQYWGTQKYIFDMTDSITIIDSAVIFRKKHPRLPLEAAESFANAYMAQNTIEGDFQGRLADYYRRHWGPTDQAERAARQAVQADPDNSYSARRLAEVLVGKGRFEEAAAVIQAAADRIPGEAVLWLVLGDIRSRMADDKDAEAAYRRALEIDQTSSRAHHQLSFALERQGRFAEALKSAEQAQALETNGGAAAFIARHVAKLRASVG